MFHYIEVHMLAHYIQKTPKALPQKNSSDFSMLLLYIRRCLENAMKHTRVFR
jgi:hypothetical protein